MFAVYCLLSQMKEVLATEAFNKSTFYSASREQQVWNRGRCYRRPALLTGEAVYNWSWRFLYDFLPLFTFFCWLQKMALEYAFFPSHVIYAVRMAAAVTSPLQTSSWTPELSLTPCHSHTLQGVDQNIISEF